MSELAYDISYLLESEQARVEVPAVRMVKPSRAPPPPSLADAQEALARELMQAADAHEALIQQYLRMSGDSWREAAAR